MNLVSSPALRPSHPHGCRKRSFGQGHALSGRFAGLDRMTLLSGYGCLRATDEEASGGGSVKGSSQARSTKATIQETCSRLSRFSRIPTCGDNNTCKAAPACAPQSSPHTYAVTARPAFRWPRHHARHADHESDTDRVVCAWRTVVRRIPSPHVPDVYLEPSVYPPAPRRIQLRSTADTHPPHSRCPHHASSFLRGCLFIRPALSPRASLRFVYTLRV